MARASTSTGLENFHEEVNQNFEIILFDIGSIPFISSALDRRNQQSLPKTENSHNKQNIQKYNIL